MGVDFTKQKMVGTAAEIALRDLLTSAGALVTCNQINRDAVDDRPGAAVAHDAAGTRHLPDLSVIWPSHSVRRFGLEAKAKSPLGRGGWGWDIRAYDRAAHWSELSGDPVFYLIRDLSAAPLPLPGESDSADHWLMASIWKLAHSPHRVSDDAFHYWPADVFLPLAVLLNGAPEISAAIVPCISLGAGQPPLIL